MMAHLKPEQKILLRFVVTLGVLVGLYYWWFVPNSWTLPIIGPNYSRFVHYTMMSLTESTVIVLRIIGYEAETFDLRNIDLYDSIINVHVRNFCLGVDMMAMFTALVVSFPGSWRNRLWFIPLGLGCIQLINIFRVTVMCVITVHYGYSNYLDRHALFNVIATIFITLMFFVWVRMYRAEATVITSK